MAGSRALLLLLLAGGLVACPGSGSTPPSGPSQPPAGIAVAPPPARDDGRLPALAAPSRYALDLDIDPSKDRFKGTVRIAITLPAATRFVVLHGRALEVVSASVERPGRPAPNRASAAARTAKGGTTPEEIVLTLEHEEPAGAATLVIAYTGRFDDELSGLYRLQDGDRWYAFTQFEPTDARRAFPCFDEPQHKVPFEVSLTVPRAMLAVANAPEATREDVGTDRRRFKFAPTQPLPTYLVALAVGDLEIKEATRFTRPPIRLVATHGKSANAALALETTSALVDALGTWFGIPYPYDKLDIVAVPDFRAGAMENPGLVTFREERLLLDPAHASTASKRTQAVIIAHELAHQWFGDLVTASWWNDLWLNEGMATWMEWRIVDQYRPAWNARLDAIAATHEVMNQDGLATARAVRQPVVSSSDADEAFDGITYEKGAAVLGTIERWIGEETFQRGIREYLKENAWKSVQADRLLAVLDRVSGKDVTGMARSYLDKPGVPEVNAALECEGGSRWHVELSSGPWRPLGTTLPEDAMASWTIPACVRTSGDKKDACAELMAGAPSMVAGRGCPTYVHPNTASSYYRYTLNERDFVRLAEARAQLDAGARISLLSNAWAAVRSGALEPKALLRILPPFDDDNGRHVVEQVVEILYGMDRTLVDDEDRAAFQRFAQARLARRKKVLGWTGGAGKSDPTGEDALARRSVLFAMADLVEDEATLREAEEWAAKWIDAPASVDADVGAIAIEIASRRGNDRRQAALLATMRGAKNREDRLVALKGLMSFGDELRLRRALDLVLTDDIHANELHYVISTVFARRREKIAESWVREHWDELRKKLPGALSRPLVRAAAVGCTSAEAEARTSFYGSRLKGVDGVARPLAEALEEVTLCAALREKGATNLRKALLGTATTKK